MSLTKKKWAKGPGAFHHSKSKKSSNSGSVGQREREGERVWYCVCGRSNFSPDFEIFCITEEGSNVEFSLLSSFISNLSNLFWL